MVPRPVEPASFDKEETLSGLQKYLLYRRGFSPAAVRAIVQSTRYLVEKYNVRYPGRDDDLRVKETMKREGLSNHTINLKLYYMEYLSDYQHQDDPAYEARPLRYEKLPETEKGKHKRKGLTIAQATVLLEAAKQRSYRDYAIVATMLYAGTRNTETCNLDVQDVDFHHAYLWILDKGVGIKNGEEDAAIITEQLAPILRGWLEARPTIETPELFMTTRQNRFDRNSMHQLIMDIGREAGLQDDDGRPIRVYPQLLRHTCGSSIIKSGGNVLDAQRQLRHKSLATTIKTYLHGDEEAHRRNLSKLRY